tara:strand:- start:212 stop:532 length:321 start_codon:yes stop_codon:yes gene_type:complete
VNHLLKKIENKISKRISNLIEKENNLVYLKIEELKKDQVFKNKMIDDLNRRLAYCENENKQILNDFLVLSNVLKDVFTTLEFLTIKIESEFDSKEIEEINKKKVIH